MRIRVLAFGDSSAIRDKAPVIRILSDGIIAVRSRASRDVTHGVGWLAGPLTNKRTNSFLSAALGEDLNTPTHTKNKNKKQKKQKKTKGEPNNNSPVASVRPSVPPRVASRRPPIPLIMEHQRTENRSRKKEEKKKKKKKKKKEEEEEKTAHMSCHVASTSQKSESLARS